MSAPRICDTCIYRHQGRSLDPCCDCMDIPQLPKWKWDRLGKSKIDQLKQDFLLARKAYMDAFTKKIYIQPTMESYIKAKQRLGDLMVDIWYATIGKPSEPEENKKRIDLPGD